MCPSIPLRPSRALCLRRKHFFATISPATSATRRARKRSSAFGRDCVPLVRKGHAKPPSSRATTPSGFALRARLPSRAASGPPIAAWARTQSIAPSRSQRLPKSPSKTLELKLHGWTPEPATANSAWECVYGSDLPALQALSQPGCQSRRPACIRACPSGSARWFGRRVMRWRGRLRTCSPGARALSFSMRVPLSKLRPRSPVCWRASSSQRRLEVERFGKFPGNCQRLSLHRVRG